MQKLQCLCEVMIEELEAGRITDVGAKHLLVKMKDKEVAKLMPA